MLGDFGCALIMKEQNNVKGCTPKWCDPKILVLIQKGQYLTMDELKTNEVHSFCLVFKSTITSIDNIATDDPNKDECIKILNNLVDQF